jgi:two-component system response regulator VicR
VTASILVVSANADTQELLKDVLCDFEVRVHSTFHGPNVLFQFYFIQPDFIILDMHQPGNQDERMLKRLRERSAVPIVVLVGPDQYETKMLCLNSGADDVLAVPFQELELQARVRALLRRAELRRAARWPAAAAAAEGR